MAFHGRNIELCPLSSSDNAIARNIAARAFLESSCEYMMIIDADLIFNRRHIDLMDASQVPILCGLYFLKQPGKPVPCVNWMPEDDGKLLREFMEVRRGPGGFMRIHRNVFEKLKPHVPIYQNHGGGWQFFKTDINEEGNLATEDFNFCDLARRHGFKIMIDTRIQLGHIGQTIYPLQESLKNEPA